MVRISSYTKQECTPTGENFRTSNQCGKILSYEQVPSQHQKIHTGVKSYKCAEFEISSLKIHNLR